MTKFAPNFPDFFIVGAPRCGTTTLSRHLARHKQIGFSKPKEPHFFSMILEEFPEADVQRDYVDRFFGHCGEKHRAIGEGSVSYLYAPKAVERILDLNPDARFIVMVRNPVDLVHSYHSRLLAILDEDVYDFSRAWELRHTRARGERIPKHCRQSELLQYEDVGKLGDQVERMYSMVGRERCMVVPLEDLIGDSLAVYKRALDFIGVDYDGRTQLEAKEGNKEYRSRWLHHVLKRPPRPMVNYLQTLDRREKRRTIKKKPLMRLRKHLLKMNTVERPRSPMKAELREQLRQTFSADVAKLGTLLGRDLSHWQ